MLHRKNQILKLFDETLLLLFVVAAAAAAVLLLLLLLCFIYWNSPLISELTDLSTSLRVYLCLVSFAVRPYVPSQASRSGLSALSPSSATQRNPSASFLLLFLLRLRLRLPFSLYLFRESLGAFCICLSNWRCSAGAAKNAKPKEKGKWGDIKKRGKREMQTEIHGKQGTWR